ncbi:MAG: F0F1 ATP synthase subunit B [Propionibacteriaceae bacterium]|jgi:F-type H+-transporting ATPase subunit b|nr:F0F1 ATP synthase subunit B [Propionibacteriaceae bacterium]
MTPLEGPLGPLLPEHISEFVVGIILFVIIYLVVRKVVVPRFETMYADRTAAISGGMEKAEQAQAEAQAALAAYKQKMAGADDEAAQIREAAKATGAQIQAEMRTEAEQEASRIVTTARAQVDAERSHAVEALRKDVGTMATVLAGKILGESLDDDARVARTVDGFIATLEDVPAR